MAQTATNSLTAMMEETMYEAISKHQPRMIPIIRELLDRGETPKRIEAQCRRMVPTHPGVDGGELTMNAIFYAASYIKKQKRAGR